MFTGNLKRVLITGGAGFIGSHIAEEMLKGDIVVTILDDLSAGKIRNIRRLKKRYSKRLEFIRGDVRDVKRVLKAVRNADAIFHEAALASVQESILHPRTYNEVNLGGTLNVLDAARRGDTKRVVFASTSAVYADAPTPIDEEAQLKLGSPYAITKLAAENYCLLYNELYGLPTVSLRYFNVFGPGQDPSGPYASVIPAFIRRVSKGLPPIIYGDGEQTRDFVHVSDVVQANVLAATMEQAIGKIFNIGSGKVVSIRDLALCVVTLSGNSRLKPIYAKAREGDARYSCADIEKARELLKYEPMVSLEKGLEMLMT